MGSGVSELLSALNEKELYRPLLSFVGVACHEALTSEPVLQCEPFWFGLRFFSCNHESFSVLQFPLISKIRVQFACLQAANQDPFNEVT